MIECYGMNDGMPGKLVIWAGHDIGQLLDVAKDSIHLMIAISSDWP